MAPPEGKILLPPTGCPGMGPGEGQELGSSTRGVGRRVCAVPGHGAAPGPPGVTPQPRRQCSGPVPIPFAFISLLFLFRVVQGQGGTEGKEMQSSCCWPLVASASDTMATQGRWRGGNAAPGSAAGSAPAACPGVAGTPHKALSHTEETQHHAQSPRIRPGGITWGERTQKPSCSPCTRSLSQQHCSLPQSLCVGTALF